MLWIGAWQDGCGRFRTKNLSKPAALQGDLKKQNLSQTTETQRQSFFFGADKEMHLQNVQWIQISHSFALSSCLKV